MTAIYRAWSLATVGRDTSLLTHSNLLHQYLAQIAPDLTESTHVTTYHRWLRGFWLRHFQDAVPQVDEEGWIYDWTTMQRECLLRGFKSSAHLVIDEGQRLPIGFYQWCRVAGIGVTVFADEDMRIGDDQSTLSEIRRALDIQTDLLGLHENRRNRREIAMLASEFRKETRGEIRLPTQAGRTPTLLKVTSVDGLLAGVARYFHAHPQRSIGIICRSTQLVREIQSKLTGLGLAKHTQAYVHNDLYRDAIDFSIRPIRVLSTASMKGLEFDSVFVPDLDAYSEDPTGVEARLRFLVLCTRARLDLHFAYRGEQEPPILADISDSLLIRHPG
ncbi:hypothetical protein [Streptomyces sp. NPDC051704]|uniref:hypothetical protein n=1 Tax=Streptomyces sp. NPDC051704 TaxID=3365671 RepID=UPI0037BD0A71